MRSSDFVNHSYDYRPNWTPLSPVTITKFVYVIGLHDVQIGNNWMKKFCGQPKLDKAIANVGISSIQILLV